MSKKPIPGTGPDITPALLPALDEWQRIAKWLETGKAREMELRIQLADYFIPPAQRVEGVNRVVARNPETGEAFEISIDHKINRKLDEAALDSIMLELPEDSDARKPGVLITWQPKLVLSGYRTLPSDQLAIFQQALEEKPGSPVLDIAPFDPELYPVGHSKNPVTQAPPQTGDGSEVGGTVVTDDTFTLTEKAKRREKIKKAAAKTKPKAKR